MDNFATCSTWTPCTDTTSTFAMLAVLDLPPLPLMNCIKTTKNEPYVCCTWCHFIVGERVCTPLGKRRIVTCRYVVSIMHNPVHLFVCLELKRNLHLIRRHEAEGLLNKFATLRKRDLLWRALEIDWNILPAVKGQVFSQSPGAYWEKDGIFCSNGIASEHLNLLQSQNMVCTVWIKYFGTGTKLVISGKHYYYWFYCNKYWYNITDITVTWFFSHLGS